MYLSHDPVLPLGQQGSRPAHLQPPPPPATRASSTVLPQQSIGSSFLSAAAGEGHGQPCMALRHQRGPRWQSQTRDIHVAFGGNRFPHCCMATVVRDTHTHPTPTAGLGPHMASCGITGYSQHLGSSPEFMPHPRHEPPGRGHLRLALPTQTV